MKTYCDYLCEAYLGVNLDEGPDACYDYPDVTDRVAYTDGTLKGGKYKGIRVMVSRKDNHKAPRTQTVFHNGKPALIHINGKQAINPAFSWYHEIAHVEEPGGQSDDPAEAEFVADRHAVRKLGMTREQYKRWLISRDSSGDSPAHIAARTRLCNNFSRYIESADEPRAVADMLLEVFSEIQKRINRIYGVDEISQNTVQNAFHKVRAITASKHTPDQTYVHVSLSNKPPIDPRYTSTRPSDPKLLKIQRDAIRQFNARRRKEHADGSAKDASKDTYAARTVDFNNIPQEHNDFYPQAKKALNGRNDVHLRLDGTAAITASGEDPYTTYRYKVTPYHAPKERLPISAV